MSSIRVPEVFKFETTTYCNLKCNFCTNPNLKKRHHINWEEFQTIWRQVEPLNPRWVDFTGLGESLLNKDIFKMLKLCCRTPYVIKARYLHEPTISEVTIDDPFSLYELLQSKRISEDSMLSSPSYFLLTGRNGLHIASKNGSHIIMAVHPNEKHSLLLFPVGDTFDIDLASEVAQMYKSKFKEIRFSRISSQHCELVGNSQNFIPVVESTLDWKFPVTILDNRLVSEMVGGTFEKFRRDVRKLAKRKIRVFENSSPEYIDRATEIHDMINRWANKVSKVKDFDVEHLVSSNRHGYLMGEKKVKNFKAFVLEVDGKIFALYTTELLPNQSTANGITLCIDREIRGSSEFAYHWMCSKHLDLGFDTTNINGAETESLDVFRQKLRPVKKLDIKTFQYTAA